LVKVKESAHAKQPNKNTRSWAGWDIVIESPRHFQIIDGAQAGEKENNSAL
jgi:hypothetical protein